MSNQNLVFQEAITDDFYFYTHISHTTLDTCSTIAPTAPVSTCLEQEFQGSLEEWRKKHRMMKERETVQNGELLTLRTLSTELLTSRVAGDL